MTKREKFTKDELQVIGDAANRAWNEIAYDILEAVGEDMPGADVVEVVLDANHLESQLARTKGVDKAFVARVAADIYAPHSTIEAHLKRHVFTHARYGM